MRGLIIAGWSQQIFMIFLALAFVESVPMVRVYASEEANIGSRVDPAMAQSVRAKFMTRLEETGDLSKEKEHWLSVYADLEDGIPEADNILREMEVELAKAKNNQRAWNRLSRQKRILSQHVSRLRMLQDLAVRQYSLLSKLELLNQSLKQRSLSRADYLNERTHIIEQIMHVEQLRLWENLTADVASTLEEIVDEVAGVETAVSKLMLK
jgi:hypothetical protein